MAERIESLQDLRPGDLMLAPIGGLSGVGIKLGQLWVDGGWRVGDVDVRHIGVVVGQLPNRGSYDLPGSPLDSNGFPAGVADSLWLAQAMPTGAELVPMSYERHWTKRHAYVRIPEDYPGQGEDAAAIARLMVSEGVDYSFLSYLFLGLWRRGVKATWLEEWIGRTRPVQPLNWPSGRQDVVTGHRGVALPVEAICSVFADQAWSLTGKKIFQDDRPHQCVTPSQLAQRLLQMQMQDGAIWGWPGLHPAL